MNHVTRHVVARDTSVREVLSRFEQLSSDAVVFLVDHDGRLISSLTDGDIRRGLIRGLQLDTPLEEFTQGSPKYLRLKEYSVDQMRKWKADNYRIIPIVNADNQIINVVNFRTQKTYLPLDALIMAGGIGSRLRPLTLTTPKPLLPVGDKPILEHNIDRLRAFGVEHLTLSVKYLGQQIVDHFGNGRQWGMEIEYITEEKPLGTIGAAGQIENIHHDHLLVMNSDLLTTIDFEEMFGELLNHGADMIVATVPYEVKIPYGIVETEGRHIVNLVEKPTYTYYSNAGIYIIRREILKLIPRGTFYNATDLMEQLYTGGRKVIQFPILDYWLDVGKPADYEKAQRDIEHLKL